MAALDVEERGEDRAESEGDRVVEEGLPDEEGQPEHRALGIAPEDRLRDEPEADALALVDGDLTRRRRQFLLTLLLDLPFDRADEFVGVLTVPVDELPPRTLRHMPAYEQDHEAQDDAQGERETPAQVLREVVRVEHDDRKQRPADRAEPVAAVDDEIDPAPVLRGDQLVDRRVDGRVLPADAEAGEEAEEEEPPRAEGQGGHRGRGEVDRQRHHEQLLAAVPVGEPAEEQSSRAGPRDVESRGQAGDLCGRDGQARALFRQPARDVADRGHFQPVEDPHRAEADDDHPVPA